MAGWPSASATRPRGMLGRVTFNPIKHVDPFGTLMLPGLLLLVQGAGSVRLRQAGAGQLRPPEPSKAGHDLGGAGRTRRQHRPGVRFGLGPARGLSAERRGHGLAQPEPRKLHTDQHLAGRVQSSSDTALGWRPGAHRAAAPSLCLAVRAARALRPADPVGSALHRALCSAVAGLLRSTRSPTCCCRRSSGSTI